MRIQTLVLRENEGMGFEWSKHQLEGKEENHLLVRDFCWKEDEANQWLIRLEPLQIVEQTFLPNEKLDQLEQSWIEEEKQQQSYLNGDRQVFTKNGKSILYACGCNGDWYECALDNDELCPEDLTKPILKWAETVTMHLAYTHWVSAEYILTTWNSETYVADSSSIWKIIETNRYLNKLGFLNLIPDLVDMIGTYIGGCVLEHVLSIHNLPHQRKLPPSYDPYDVDSVITGIHFITNQKIAVTLEEPGSIRSLFVLYELHR